MVVDVFSGAFDQTVQADLYQSTGEIKEHDHLTSPRTRSKLQWALKRVHWSIVTEGR